MNEDISAEVGVGFSEIFGAVGLFIAIFFWRSSLLGQLALALGASGGQKLTWRNSALVLRILCLGIGLFLLARTFYQASRYLGSIHSLMDSWRYLASEVIHLRVENAAALRVGIVKTGFWGFVLVSLEWFIHVVYPTKLPKNE
jgi:hypothetical protein